MGNDGVHIAHCCKEHGCKYGDTDCPVAYGHYEQDHPCPECIEDEKESNWSRNSGAGCGGDTVGTHNPSVTADVRSYNVGTSDYAKHKIQPWSIWLEYGLNPWDADIVKRVLRNKEGESRELDYEKIKHICDERIRQIREEKVGE